jgi:hypothetical protein
MLESFPRLRAWPPTFFIQDYANELANLTQFGINRYQSAISKCRSSLADEIAHPRYKQTDRFPLGLPRLPRSLSACTENQLAFYNFLVNFLQYLSLPILTGTSIFCLLV